MKNNQVIQGNITRSNVTTKITDNSSVINDNSRDFSLGGLSTGSIGNRGNIDNSSMSGDAMRIGGTNTATGNTNTSNKSQKESKKKNEVASTPKTSSGGGAGGYGMSGRNSGNMMNNITGGLMPQ